MVATFSFHVDDERSLVRVTLAGFFTVADVADFVTARDDAHRRLRCAANAHVTLVDIRGMSIQSQDVVAEFRRVLADPGEAGRRIAFVVAQSLARMQVTRAAEGRGAGYFMAVEEAERWLLEEQAAAA